MLLVLSRRLIQTASGVCKHTTLYRRSNAGQSFGSTSSNLEASTRHAPLRVCVVGAGPAGFYTVDNLLKSLGDTVRVDLLDRLPTPFGLVRSGVAPDHQDTKNVTRQFTAAVGRSPQCSLYGNVKLGRDVSLQELRRWYHAVVLSYGAESDRRLNIPGEDTPGVLPAREFVWWYNGHPDASGLPVDLSNVTSVAVCGIGNVALDCARILLQPASRLEPTDVAAHALRELRGSAVRAVHLVARRGPVQAACTPKELKELLTEMPVVVRATPEQLQLAPQDLEEVKQSRIKRRVVEIINKAIASPSSVTPPPGQPPGELHLQFLRQPVEVVADPKTGRVAGLRVERTQLRPGTAAGDAASAVGTGEFETIPCQLVLKSIGYKALPVAGVAFDEARGVVPNLGGRVLKQVGGTEVDTGLYVCGWLKRGATGIIGTNSMDAKDTVAAIVDDVEELIRRKRDTDRPADRSASPSFTAVSDGQLPAAPDSGIADHGSLRELLSSRGVRAVSFAEWEALDAAEVAAGSAVGRVRAKVVDVGEMIRIASGLPPLSSR